MVMWTLCWTDGRRDKGAKEFKDFKSAKKFAREKICEIYVDDIVVRIRRGLNKGYRNAIADFLEKCFSMPGFPNGENEIPSDKESDYPMAESKTDWGHDIFLSPGSIFSKDDDVIPIIVTNMVLFSGEYDKYYEDNIIDESTTYEEQRREWPGICSHAPHYKLQFDLEGRGNRRVGGKPRVNSAIVKLYMTVRMEPLDIAMILKEGKKPMSRDEIAETFFSEQTYDGFDGPIIDDRTLSHQIETLIGIGAIRELTSGSYEMATLDDGSPYYINPQSKLSTSAYPLAILNVLALSDKPLNLQEIADEINKKYGSSIKRQTVGKHLTRLMEDDWLGIQKDKTGYFISHDKEKEGTPE